VTQSISVRELIQRTEKQFELADLHFGHGTDNALDESFYLVMAAAGLEFDCSEEKLDEPIQQDLLNHIEALIEQRVNQRIPVAYLVNEAWFAGQKYYVDERVLIPRSPLAELITSQFMPWLSFSNVDSILDIGTGSACIACACAYAFRHARVDAVDVDVDAIEVANKNVSTHQLEGRVSIIKSNLFEQLKDKKYDLIISNPPYVGNDEMQSLPKEYLHEPGHALEASDNGLQLVEKILKQASTHLNDNGVLVVEVGNSMDVLIERYPTMPFTWLEFEEGGHGVFLLNKSDLEKFNF
jgi:ribosomal protein L3 glutamine methyltransferase